MQGKHVFDRNGQHFFFRSLVFIISNQLKNEYGLEFVNKLLRVFDKFQNQIIS